MNRKVIKFKDKVCKANYLKYNCSTLSDKINYNYGILTMVMFDSSNPKHKQLVKEILEWEKEAAWLSTTYGNGKNNFIANWNYIKNKIKTDWKVK